MCDIRLKKITVEPSNAPFIIQNGNVNITDTTSTISTLTGALVIDGGIGIHCSVDASSATAGGSLTIGGGVGIMKSVYIGNNLTMDSSDSVFDIGGLTDSRLFIDNSVNKHFYIAPNGANRRFDLYDTYLHMNLTAPSTNSTSASFVIDGGVGINSTESSVNCSNGGALTVAGGIAIGKNANINGVVFSGGIKVKNTDINQIILQNASDIDTTFINVTNNNLNITNTHHINISSSSSGNVVLNSVITIGNSFVSITKPIVLTDLTASSGVSSAALVLSGGQSIITSQDASSLTSGGALTVNGGVSVGKKMFLGDTLGLDVLHTKTNKCVFFQQNNDLTDSNDFTGIGNTLNSLIFTGNNHIFSNGLDELLRITSSGSLLLQGDTQSFLFSGINNDLFLSGQHSGASLTLGLSTSNGLGESNAIHIYSFGSSGSTDSNFFQIGYDGNNYVLQSFVTGSTLQQNLIISNMMNFSKEHYIHIFASGVSTNSSSGAFVVTGGIWRSPSR